jgi:ubiquinone/menaquinone biosynthesis C-methylase UbiE
MTDPKPDVVRNVDRTVVDGFGYEWSRFDQSVLSERELREMFDGFFRVFPLEKLSPGAVGLDIGCGSGRWARFVAPHVGKLICVDASEDAANVARRVLADLPNCEVHVASVDAMPVPDGSMDFAYSMGVLHHVPDIAAALRSCAAKLRPGAPFGVYLYYAFDNRSLWFRAIWRASVPVRLVVARTPRLLRYLASQVIAALIYWPLARVARLAERLGARNVEPIPLSYYRNRSFYVMRNDALDRFGTKLEQRFTRAQIREMLESAGFEKVVFSDHPPFWNASAIKR